MVLSTKTGRALLARPTLKKGEEMADKAKSKSPQMSVRLPMTRVCGRWQKPGYVADDAEQKAWEKRCKDRGYDVKTGKPIAAKVSEKK